MTWTTSIVFVVTLLFAAFHLGTANDMTRDWHWCVGGADVTPDQQIQGCTTIIKSDKATPDTLAEAFLFRGYAYYKRHDYGRAIADFNDTIRLDPTNETAYNARGAAFKAERQYDRAIQDYDKAISLKPDYADAFYNRGNAYRPKRDFARAIQDYDRAIQLKPKWADAFSARCRARALGTLQLDIAMADCNQALTLQPGDGETLESRGLVYFRMGQFDKAIADFTAAERKDPQRASALYFRGLARKRLGDNGGDTDIAAAKSIDTTIIDSYAAYGLVP